MNEEILFSEKQKFKQWWLWLILLGVNGIILFGFLKPKMDGQSFGNNTISNFEFIVISVLTILLTVLFANFRLETIIKNNGIYVRFFPFHFKFKYYPWDSLTKSFVRQYSAIMEYGGWGIRIGLFGKGKAYNISGNQGLQLEFMNKKKLLIGTKKPDELAEVLNKIGQIKE